MEAADPLAQQQALPPPVGMMPGGEPPAGRIGKNLAWHCNVEISNYFALTDTRNKEERV